MSSNNQRTRLERLTLAGASVRGAVAGAVRALVDWLLDWVMNNHT
jgi:hypothetical protein